MLVKTVGKSVENADVQETSLFFRKKIYSREGVRLVIQSTGN